MQWLVLLYPRARPRSSCLDCFFWIVYLQLSFLSSYSKSFTVGFSESEDDDLYLVCHFNIHILFEYAAEFCVVQKYPTFLHGQVVSRKHIPVQLHTVLLSMEAQPEGTASFHFVQTISITKWLTNPRPSPSSSKRREHTTPPQSAKQIEISVN